MKSHIVEYYRCSALLSITEKGDTVDKQANKIIELFIFAQYHHYYFPGCLDLSVKNFLLIEITETLVNWSTFFILMQLMEVI